VNDRRAEGVLLTGVYGSGKSSVAVEIAYLLEQQGTPYALLDLDYLSWAGPDTDDRAAEIDLLSQNLAAVTPNYRRLGVTLFVLAYFVRSAAEVQAIQGAMSLPLLRVVRLTVPLPAIEQRLASDVTSSRRDDLRQAAAQVATAEGADLADVTISNDGPIGLVTREVMTFLGWRHPG
jgi:adenylylsulfate kinase